MNAKWSGPSVIEQICSAARDAAYTAGEKFDLLAIAHEVGRPLSGKERELAQKHFGECLAEKHRDEDSLWAAIREAEHEEFDFLDPYPDPDEGRYLEGVADADMGFDDFMEGN